jgi:dolichol-phosphate mannosyltransferase
MSVELSVIVPTYNEAPNIRPLLEKLSLALAGVNWEAIFVDDDSPDGTADLLRLAASSDSRIRVVNRIGRRGLATACIEGFLASSAPYLAVMDADLQHDESLLPKMLQILKNGDIDIVVASRYVEGGGTGDWAESRRSASRLATRCADLILPCPLNDPMSGFFAVTAPFLLSVVRNLTGVGYKILLDIVASSPHRPKVVELPYCFRPRVAGASKLDTKVVLEYFQLLLEKFLPAFVPLRLSLFISVGFVGAIGHLTLFFLLYRIWHLTFTTSQIAAALLAMTLNFALNNMLTYRDNSLRGIHFLLGLLSFYAICSIGAYVNVQIASSLIVSGVAFWSASLSGAVLGGLWNYAVSSAWTWQPRGARQRHA